MGQQQLLLIVLGIVVVGIAVVVGIQAFTENKVKSNIDARTSDAVRVASDAQAWFRKPASYGGGNSSSFTGLTLERLGYTSETSATGSCPMGWYSNANGCITPLVLGSGNQVAINSLPPRGTANPMLVMATVSADDVTTITMPWTDPY